MTDTDRIVDLMALLEPDRCANAQDVVFALDAAFAAVRRDERLKVAAWLRSVADSMSKGPMLTGHRGLGSMADQIENGEHA